MKIKVNDDAKNNTKINCIWKVFLKNLLYISVTLITICLTRNYTKQWSMWNCVLYLVLCVIIPVVVVIFLFKENKLFYLYLILILFIIVYCLGYYFEYSFKTEEKIEMYLSQDSDFENNAEIVMPTQEILSDNNIVFYNYIEKKDTQLYFLTVQYKNNDFMYEKERMENLNYWYTSQFDPAYMGEDIFFLDGKLYSGMVYYHNDYYSIAFHICSDDNTVSYIFLKNNSYLQTMTMGQTLSLIFHNRVFIP